MNIERRYTAARFEVRAAQEGVSSPGTIIGHASVFNTPSLALYDPWEGTFREQVRPGAFDSTLETSDARALFNHNPDLILGRMSAGTCRVWVDNIGLAYEVDAPDTQTGRDLCVSAARNDINQSSFSFSIPPGGEEWGWDDSGIPLRTLTVIDPLYDVSPVTYPAYPAADSGLRAALRGLATQRSVDLDEAVKLARSGQIGRLLPGSAGNPDRCLIPEARMHQIATEARRHAGLLPRA